MYHISMGSGASIALKMYVEAMLMQKNSSQKKKMEMLSSEEWWGADLELKPCTEMSLISESVHLWRRAAIDLIGGGEVCNPLPGVPCELNWFSASLC